MTGRLTKLRSSGFGFIECDGIDFFFHRTDYDGDWKLLLKKFVAGDIISVGFDNDTSPNHPGPKAMNVRLVQSMDNV